MKRWKMNNEDSLKSLTARQLVKLLSQDVVDILRDSARRGTAYLVEYNEWSNQECPYIVWGKYEETTPKEVLYRIMREPCYIFCDLLYVNEGVMKGHEIFSEYLKSKKEGDYELKFVRPELIEYLYTKIKKPEDLIEDLRNIGDQYTDYFIVFEYDSCWKNSIKYRNKISLYKSM